MQTEIISEDEFPVFNKYKEEYMQVKIEQARQLLRELDRLTDRAFLMKVRRMVMLQEALDDTRRQLGMRN